MVALFGAATGSYPVTVLSASLPTIAENLGTSDNTITWVIASPLLAFALATPIAGKMGDLYGHRRIYLGGFMAGCLLSFATSLAWDVASLIVLRTLAQTAIAVSGPSAMAMILSIYPKRERPRALGIWLPSSRSPRPSGWSRVDLSSNGWAGGPCSWCRAQPLS